LFLIPGSISVPELTRIEPLNKTNGTQNKRNKKKEEIRKTGNIIK